MKIIPYNKTNKDNAYHPPSALRFKNVDDNAMRYLLFKTIKLLQFKTPLNYVKYRYYF